MASVGVTTGIDVQQPMGFGDWFLLQIGQGMLWGLRPDVGFVTSSGGLISSVADRSGFGDPAAQGTGIFKPTLTASWRNGRPAMNFSGTRRLVTTGPIIPLTDYSFGGVIEYTSVPSAHVPLSFGGAVGGVNLTIDTSTHKVNFKGVGSLDDGSTQLTTANDIVVTRTLVAGVNTVRMYINDVEKPLAGPNPTQIAASGASIVGAINTAGVSGFVGNIGDLFVLNFPMTAAQVHQRWLSTSSLFSLS